MMEGLMRLLAFVVLVGFLGILVWHVQRTDLMVVVGVTALLVAWDFFGAKTRG